MPGGYDGNTTQSPQEHAAQGAPHSAGQQKQEFTTTRAKAAFTGFFDLLAEKIEVYTPKVKSALNEASTRAKGTYSSLADRGEEVQKRRSEYKPQN